MAEEMIEKGLLAIQKRLDILISLILKRELQDKTITMRETISHLSSVGLTYSEIAAIFGKSASYVASELTLLKKRGEKNARTKKSH
jgi:DNA-binding CsgD family transcriptional regulator